MSALLSKEDAEKIIAEYVRYYNGVRLHSAINYVTPEAKLKGGDTQILKERELKLAKRREERKLKCSQSHQNLSDGTKNSNGEDGGSLDLIRISTEGRGEAPLCRISS